MTLLTRSPSQRQGESKNVATSKNSADAVQQKHETERLIGAKSHRSMLASIALRIAGLLWQGPAIAVKLSGHRRPIKLGRGNARTTLVIGNSVSLWQLLRNPSLGFGEGYVKKQITINGDIMDVLLGYHRNIKVFGGLRRLFLSWTPRSRAARVEESKANAQHHYDIGNDFYRLWLDPSLTYSCAYFPNGSETLAEAQEAKRDLICRKLMFSKAGQAMLDIGCGWGSLLFHAAEHYGAIATGITPAEEQARYIKEEAAERGLADRIKVIVGDWREHAGVQYDRIASVGMFEHVGEPQYADFFRVWRSLLQSDGISLLHTIGHTRRTGPDPWIDKYIFPGGYLPAEDEIRQHVASAGLTIPDGETNDLPSWHNLRPHYAKTLALWAESYATVKGQVIQMFNEKFYRMWWLYLKASEAGFREGDLQLYQVVLLGPEATWKTDAK